MEHFGAGGTLWNSLEQVEHFGAGGAVWNRWNTLEQVEQFGTGGTVFNRWNTLEQVEHPGTGVQSPVKISGPSDCTIPDSPFFIASYVANAATEKPGVQLNAARYFSHIIYC
jgi:hypothetical protein